MSNVLFLMPLSPIDDGRIMFVSGLSGWLCVHLCGVSVCLPLYLVNEWRYLMKLVTADH